MKPVCVKCQIEMRPKQNGVKAVSMAICGAQEIRSADLWACPGCGVEILNGFAGSAEMSAYEAGFNERLVSYELDARQRVIEFWMNQREKEQATAKGTATA